MDSKWVVAGTLMIVVFVVVRPLAHAAARRRSRAHMRTPVRRLARAVYEAARGD